MDTWDDLFEMEVVPLWLLNRVTARMFFDVRFERCSYAELVRGYYVGLNPHPDDEERWITEWELVD